MGLSGREMYDNSVVDIFGMFLLGFEFQYDILCCFWEFNMDMFFGEKVLF